jgi:hypothetical protein
MFISTTLPAGLSEALISGETQDMTFEQFKAYVEQRLKKTLHPNATWQIKGGM